jgi:hypothetical protein
MEIIVAPALADLATTLVANEATEVDCPFRVTLWSLFLSEAEMIARCPPIEAGERDL